jgi:hypothetical protein
MHISELGNREVTIIVLVLCFIIAFLAVYFSFLRKKAEDHH